MASDTVHSPLLPAAWRLTLAFALTALAAHLVITTQYYATIFLIASAALVLMFAVARLLQQGQSAAEMGAVDRAVARMQEEQKRAAQTQDHLQALLDTVSAALLVVKPDGRVAGANRAARLLLRGQGPRLSDIGAIGTGAAEAISQLTPGARAVVRLAGGQQMLASALQFVGGGESRRLVSLQAVMGELDAVQLKAWEDMSRVLAHEIMNSLTPIASLSESLSGMIRQEGASRESVEAIDTIARRSQGLAGFVARYRQMAELPEPRLQVIALKAFAAEIERLMAGHLDGIDYKSRVETDQLVADPDLLSQAVINLLHNAVDAVAGKRDASIAFHCARQDDAVLISVADNGKGVPAEYADDIFVPFFTTKAGGSGIGLSLVRQIALKHGGQIAVCASPSGGASFQLSLPSR
jgi:nitrogen fixation/metabolism regulation signal transduction histidine kinase